MRAGVPVSRAAFDHLLGELRLGGDVHLVRDGGLLAAFDVAGPGLGQVQGTVDTRVPVRCR
jgi:hypothetical protein